MAGHQQYHQAQYTLVVGAAQGSETFISSPDQPPPFTQLLHHPPTNEAHVTSPPLVYTANAIAPQWDMAITGHAIPIPPTLAQAISPTTGGAGGGQAMIRCPGCSEEMTKGALWRHKTYSCPRAQKYDFPCKKCPKWFTRPDAVKRHLKERQCSGRSPRGASRRSTSSSNSNSGGDPHTGFLIMPQTLHVPNPLESLSSPIPPAPAAVTPTSMDTSENHGLIQPQRLLTLYADHINHSLFIRYDQPGLAAQFFSSQCPLLRGTSLATHQGFYLHSQPIGVASQISSENVPPFRYWYQPSPVALASQSRGEQPSDCFIPGSLPNGDQFLPDISMATHEAPPMPTGDHCTRMQHDHHTHQAIRHSLAITQGNHSQPEAGEQTFTDDALPSAIFSEGCDLIRGQPRPGPPTYTPQEDRNDDQAMTQSNISYFPHAPRLGTPEPSEFQTALIHDPHLELGHGSTLETSISSDAGFPDTYSWAMLYPPSEDLTSEGPRLDCE